MKTIAIRRAVSRDLDRLVDIELSVFDTDQLTRGSFARALVSAASRCLVAETGGRVVGYALVNFRRNSKKARLFSLARMAGAPRGCGRALLAAAEDIARKRGCLSMRLEVREDNSRAIALYDRAGYRRFGRHPEYYEDGAPALRFEKALDTAEAVRNPARSADRPDRTPRRRATIR